MTEVVWLLLPVPLLASLGTHRLLHSVYQRYRAVRNHVGLEGRRSPPGFQAIHAKRTTTDHPSRGEAAPMALSDQLTELTARAKNAEERAAAAQGKAKADVQADVEKARASAQDRAKKLRESAEANKNKLSVWWYDLQRTWNEHVAKIREDIDAKRAEHDMDRAQRRAERRVEDAVFAIEFAYAAIEEAEYAVLDAELARMEANELAAA